MKYFTILIACLIVVGCSKNVSVSGKITYSDNGLPLTSGIITFTNGVIQARSNISSTGMYSVGLLQDGDGIVPGEYKVIITALTLDKGDLIPLIDPKFSTMATTPFSVKIETGQKIDFQVDRAKIDEETRKLYHNNNQDTNEKSSEK
jgi:glucose/arabinose dehydrogenase